MNIDQDFVFPVYIYNKTLEEIKKFCRNSELEIFGYLIGNIYKWNDMKYIIIEDQLFINGAIHSHKYSTSQIEGTAGKYEKKFQKMKLKKHNDELRIVGWWHSHPGFGCFLSSTDLNTQEYFFYESYQVALVVDPINNELEFFTLEAKTDQKYKTLDYAIIQ